MKILNVTQIREADEFTIKHEPISRINLMERAGLQCYKWITSQINKQKHVHVFCGLGNNGGDGLVIARYLLEDGYNVQVFVVTYSDDLSEEFRSNYERYSKIDSDSISDITDETTLPTIHEQDVIIDAILGTGTNKPVSGILAKVIDHINTSNALVYSIDMPSGLYADQSNHLSNSSIVRATTTLSLQLPKLSMLFPENAIYVGNWLLINIGLSKQFIEDLVVENRLITEGLCKKIFRSRDKFAHKGHFGHALLISGSWGKTGASVLASRATMRSGVGLLTSHIPQCGYDTLQTAIPEAMVETDVNHGIITLIPDTSNYHAIAIGPGIGQAQETQHALRNLLEQYCKPLVIDADAINILSYNKNWLHDLPQGSILTPHIREFERLVGRADNDFHRNEMQRDLSKKHNIYIVLKGAHTAISCPDGTCYYNTTGNPGMATAGAGDVLTGILLGLLAQGYSPKHSCLLGVFIHGKSGDFALSAQNQNSLIASDIIEHLGQAFKFLEHSEKTNEE